MARRTLIHARVVGEAFADIFTTAFSWQKQISVGMAVSISSFGYEFRPYQREIGISFLIVFAQVVDQQRIIF